MKKFFTISLMLVALVVMTTGCPAPKTDKKADKPAAEGAACEDPSHNHGAEGHDHAVEAKKTDAAPAVSAPSDSSTTQTDVLPQTSAVDTSHEFNADDIAPATSEEN